MSLMDSMMDGMVKRLPKEKREEMMVNMMPMMMEGIDINEFMPKMMTEMLKDVTVDDVINFLKEALKDKEKLQELLGKLKDANLMYQMMFKAYTSKLSFDETITAISEAATQNGWVIPDVRDVQKHWQEDGLTEVPKIKTIYFCMPHTAYRIFKEDKNEAMVVMMPMGVSVYETADGQVGVGTYNMDMMSGMFPGLTGEVLSNAAKNLAKTLEGIVE